MHRTCVRCMGDENRLTQPFQRLDLSKQNEVSS